MHRGYIFRPAGLSDDEHDYYLSDEELELKGAVYQFGPPVQELTNTKLVQLDDEQHDLEFNLLNACMSGNLDVIDEYFQTRNVNDFLHTGWTPLLYSSLAVCSPAMEQLLRLGADANLHKDGFTPLMALCSSTKGCLADSLKCLSLLLDAKADVNASNKQRETALMFACKYREVEFVEELLKKVKNIDAVDSEQQSALFYAVTANRPDMVNLLLQNKASITLKDRHNETVVQIATIKEYKKVLDVLEWEDGYDPTEDCKISKLVEWTDMFPMLNNKNDNTVDQDIDTILYGMGFENYKKLFRGMSLKTFLSLTEEDLVKLGMDVSGHREAFLEDLYKFHSKKWNVRSLGSVKKSLPYTIYDGVVSLGNAAKQISVIGSSFKFLKHSLEKAKESDIVLTDKQKAEYIEELRKTQQSVRTLRKELSQMKLLAARIDKESSLGTPASYVGKKQRKYNWTIIVTIVLMVGMYLSKSPHVRSVWNN